MALQNMATKTMDEFLIARYQIPNYQREYVWEETHLGDFWDDLESTITDKSSTHFFGQIVIHKDEEENRKYIIDGQQRTITSTLFLRVLQIFYAQIFKNTSNSDANQKQSEISGKIGWNADDCHLKLNESDEDYFLHIFQLDAPDREKQKKRPHERMRRAFCFFYDKVKAKLNNIPDVLDKIKLLNEYYDAFTARFVILYVEASKLDEAFIIFETLNARGCDLEVSDLLKNFLFSRADSVESAQKLWTKMINSLEKTDPTKFIRHFWNSHHPFTREKELYGKISKEISTREESNALFDKLVKYAPCYHDLAFPEQCAEFSDTRLIISLRALKMLKAKIFYPLILALRQVTSAFTEEDIGKVSEMIETYVFRNYTICGRNSNSGEKFFADIAKSVFDGKITSISEICEKIRAEMVNDEEFLDSFNVWCASRSTKEIARYILRKIHRYLDVNNEISASNNDVHIEHIMPENNSIWHVPDKIHEEYLWRLGNLALLGEPLNKSASNKAFDEKKSRYYASKIEPNKKIAEYSQWTSAEIEERQKQLADYALHIWSK